MDLLTPHQRDDEDDEDDAEVEVEATPHFGPNSPDGGGRPVAMLMLVGLAVAVFLLLLTTFRNPAPHLAAAPVTPSCTFGSAEALPAALTAAGPPGQPVVTPASAKTVLTALWPLREISLQSCDLGTLRRLETGTALLGDEARARCHCLVRRDGAPIDESALFVPRQTTYPAYFLAQVRTEEADGNSWAEAMVFTRARAGAPWRLALSTGYGAAADKLAGLGTPDTDAAGYAKVPDGVTRASAERAPALLAGLWQESRNSGTVPESRFAPSPWTTSLPQQMAAYPQDLPQPNGLAGHFEYAVDARAPLVHVLSGGSDLMCGAVRTTTTYTPVPGGDWPYQNLDRTNWGSELAPGSYRSITLRGVSQTCFLVPPRGDGHIFALGGDADAEATATGVLVSRSGRAR